MKGDIGRDPKRCEALDLALLTVQAQSPRHAHRMIPCTSFSKISHIGSPFPRAY